jgi:squalene-associated FAD-dependent desaturase
VTESVAIAGGGLAGMSAAVALATAGYRVALLEKRAALGGRAGSYLEPATGEWIDNCQHVLMPCCTNLLDFYERIGVREKIRFHSEIPFLDAGGRLSLLRSSSLPAPFHCAPSFLRLRFLSAGDKLRVARGLSALLMLARRGTTPAGTALDWFRAHGQNDGTIARFWELVLVSALNENLERASLAYAAKVFLEAFLAHPRGWWLGVPSCPLGALYDEPVARFLRDRGGELRLRTAVERVVAGGGRLELDLSGGERMTAERLVVALPWRAAAAVLPPELPEGLRTSLREGFQPSPITGVHLWFDRPVTQLEFAALPGKQVQWFFNKSRNYGAGGGYLQLVTSASRSWMELTKAQVMEIALAELRDVLPEVRGAQLVESHVLKEPAATWSPTPESERLRPGARTPIANLFLAGDWVRTGWPATMEGAVRGGYLAAEAVLATDGRPAKIRAADLAPAGLMRFAGRLSLPEDFVDGAPAPNRDSAKANAKTPRRQEN